MTVAGTAALVVLAALLEAAGDAIVRFGLLRGGGTARAALFAAGAAVLLGYALLVNRVPGGFGRALGLYAAVFLLVAQAMDWAAFGGRPAPGVLAGGVLVLLGGAVMLLWR